MFTKGKLLVGHIEMFGLSYRTGYGFLFSRLLDDVMHDLAVRFKLHDFNTLHGLAVGEHNGVSLSEMASYSCHEHVSGGNVAASGCCVAFPCLRNRCKRRTLLRRGITNGLLSYCKPTLNI